MSSYMYIDVPEIWTATYFFSEFVNIQTLLTYIAVCSVILAVIDTCAFRTSSAYILFLQSNPLKSSTFQQALTTPVAQKDSHLGKPWFHKELSLNDAEDMLKRVRMDGAFLVRPSEKKSQSTQQNYSISFRYIHEQYGQGICTKLM